jgi:ABC-2 type transport system permease protein
MNKTFIILKHEFWQTLRNRSFLILTLSLPLLAILGVGIYQGVHHWYHPAAPQEEKIGYVDQTGMFNEYTSQTGVLFVLYPDEGKAKDVLLAKDIKEYFVIPTDYLSNGVITRYTMSREVVPSTKTTGQITDFLLSNLLAGEVSPQVLDRVKAPLLLASIRLDETGEIAPSQDVVSSYFVPIVFATLFIISIMFSSGFLFQSITEEKENRVIEILLSSVSSGQLMVGKVLGLGTAGLIQVAVWFVTFVIFSRVAPGIIPSLGALSVPASLIGWGLVYFILGYLLLAALSAGIGSIGATAREGQGWSTIFTLPAISPLWFNYFIIGSPEGAVSRTLTFFPLTSPVTAMMRLASHAISAWEIALSLIILAGSIALTMWFAAKIFRVFLLMYGKRLAFREIVRYVREA